MNKKNAVIVSCFDWYEKRLIYIEEYLKKNNYNVIIIISDYNHINKKYDRHLEKNNNIKYIHVNSYKKNISISRIISHYIFSLNVKKELQKIKPDLIYCLLPPNILAKRISKIKDKLKFMLIYDVIDMWPESFLKIKKIPFLFNFWKNIRKKSLKKADKIIVECEYYKKTLDKEFYGKIQTLYLTAPSIDKKRCVNPKEKTINLCYLGSINSLIDISRICDIVTKIKQIKFVNVKIIGAGENKDVFISELEKVGANVEFYGKVYEINKIQEIFEDCHFGLNIYKEGLEIGLTIKSIDYIRLGIPLINSIAGDTYNLVQSENIGINIDQFSLEKLNDLLNNYEEIISNVNKTFDKYFNEVTINNRINFLEE